MSLKSRYKVYVKQIFSTKILPEKETVRNTML